MFRLKTIEYLCRTSLIRSCHRTSLQSYFYGTKSSREVSLERLRSIANKKDFEADFDNFKKEIESTLNTLGIDYNKLNQDVEIKKQRQLPLPPVSDDNDTQLFEIEFHELQYNKEGDKFIKSLDAELESRSEYIANKTTKELEEEHINLRMTETKQEDLDKERQELGLKLEDVIEEALNDKDFDDPLFQDLVIDDEDGVALKDEEPDPFHVESDGLNKLHDDTKSAGRTKFDPTLLHCSVLRDLLAQQKNKEAFNLYKTYREEGKKLDLYTLELLFDAVEDEDMMVGELIKSDIHAKYGLKLEPPDSDSKYGLYEELLELLLDDELPSELSKKVTARTEDEDDNFYKEILAKIQ